MARITHRTLLAFTLPFSLFAFAAACGDENKVALPKASQDAGKEDTPPEETPPPEEKPAPTTPKPPFDAGDPACKAPQLPSRGVEWVRAHPMVIAGLNLSMGAPDAGAVNEYFDGFHATTVHLSHDGLPTELAGWAAANHPGFQWIAWVNPDGTSTTNGLLLGGDAGPVVPGRIGYQIGNAPQTSQALTAILDGAAAAKVADPDGLRIVNVDDSAGGNSVTDSAAAAENVDVVSLANFAYGTDALNALMRVRTAAQAAKKPYWRYAQSFYKPSDGIVTTTSDLRWDAFVGAVFGYTGLTWFVYDEDGSDANVRGLLFDGGADFGAEKTPFYATAATLNQQLRNLGKTLSLLKSTDVRYKAAIGFVKPQSIQPWDPAANSDPYLKGVTLGTTRELLLGFFRDDCGEAYVMVQNQAHAGADLPNNGTANADFTLSFDFTGAPAGTDATTVLAMDPATGTVAPRGMVVPSPGTANLALDLPPGGVFFFKYKTGRAFVSQ